MVELLTPDEMGRVDRAAVGLGTPLATLMQAAGRAVVRAVRRRYRPCRTVVLCGPGNNGGDGVVVARGLLRSGWPVTVAAPGGPLVLPWSGPESAFVPAEIARADLVIDALYGAGLGRDIEGATADVLRAATRVVAIDVPSGVDGATGQVRGFAAQAELTVTFFRAKPGHFLFPGRELCGELEVADIGIPEAVLGSVPAKAFRNGPGLWRVPEPGARAHKYTRGFVTVLGGPAMTGAARLAAVAARRSGAGMVAIAARSGAEVYRAGEPGTIVTDAPLADMLRDERRTVWVCGPGLGSDDAARALPVLLASGREIVVDADALTLCAGHAERLRGAAVLTPHEGEFTKLFGSPAGDRLAAVRRAVEATGAVVVLKGADTVVGAPGGVVAINDSAPPWLATAGSGDVLSGIVAGLLAQGMPRWEAACAAVWLHGRAGHHAGPNLIAEDLASALPAAFAEAVRLR